jgi:hypothetical protein
VFYLLDYNIVFRQKSSDIPEHTVPTFRAKEKSMQEPAPIRHLLFCSTFFSPIKMETMSSSKISVDFHQTARCYIPDDRILNRPIDSQHYHIFWEVVGLEWGPLSIVSTTEQLLERKRCGSGLENRKYGRRDPSRWQNGTLYPQKLTRTSPTSSGRSVGIVHSQTKATEFFFSFMDRERETI